MIAASRHVRTGSIAASQPQAVIYLTGTTGYHANSVAATSDTVTLTATPTASNALVAFVFEFPNVSGPVLALSGCGGTWTRQVMQMQGTFACSVWTGTGLNGTGNQVTWISPAAMSNEIAVYAVNNLVTVTGLQTSSDASASLLIPDTGTLTPAKSSGIILGALCLNGAQVGPHHADLPANWTPGPNSSDFDTGTYNVTATVSHSYQLHLSNAIGFAGAQIYLPTS